jgi:hypothetical protein
MVTRDLENIITYLERFKPEKEICWHIWSPALRHDRIRISHAVWHAPCRHWEQAFWEGGKPLEERSRNLRGGVLRGRHRPWHDMTAFDRPAGDARGLLTSQDLSPPVLETAAGACAQVHLVGEWACLTDAHFLVPRSCHAPSSKIDI